MSHAVFVLAQNNIWRMLLSRRSRDEMHNKKTSDCEAGICFFMHLNEKTHLRSRCRSIEDAGFRGEEKLRSRDEMHK